MDDLSDAGAAEPIQANVGDSEAYRATVDVAEVLDRSRIGGFHVRILVLAFLVTTMDGLELGISAFAGPDLSWDWYRSGPDNAATLFGSLGAGVLSPTILGYLADRFGRRPVIVAGAFALFALAVLAIASIGRLVGTRALTKDITLIGIALAGTLPILVSLVSEFSPKRVRTTMIVLVLTGLACGGALRALIGTNYFVQDGVRVLFWIGALGPLAMAPLLLFALPESAKYLALNPARREELIALLRRIDRALQIGPGTTFIITSERNQPRFTFGALLRGPLAALTPLYWISNFTALMAFNFVGQQALLFLLGSGLSAEQTDIATALFYFSGALAALLSMRLIDRFGFFPVPVLFASSIPIVIGIGVMDLASSAYVVLVASAWFCLLGLQFGNVATEANIYPTYVRAFGVGLNFAVARVGSGLALSLLGPGPFGLYFPPPNMFAPMMVPLIIGLVAAALIVPRYPRQA
jgi:MFS transporter, AAHS family, 4-hydroxybenzoate transporter